MHITPCLWFDRNGEEAIQFYMSVFPSDSRLGAVNRCGDAGPGPKGSILTATFTLLGREFMVLNGGPYFTFNEAVSMAVSCDTQQEVDALWEKLTGGGGQESQCGWLKDRFGLSWQIVPKRLMELLGDKDEAKVNRVTQAMLQMKKIDVPALEKAYRG